jgi:hypothetical protein
LCGAIIIQDEKVGVAVIVDVPESRPTPDIGELKYPARLVAHILKSAIAEVSEQLIALAQRVPVTGTR